MKLIPALAVEQEVRQLEREAASGRAELDALRGKHEQVRTHPAVPMQTLASGGCQQADGRDLRPFLPRRLRVAAARSVSMTASISFVEPEPHGCATVHVPGNPRSSSGLPACLERGIDTRLAQWTPRAASDKCGAATLPAQDQRQHGRLVAEADQHARNVQERDTYVRSIAEKVGVAVSGAQPRPCLGFQTCKVMVSLTRMQA